MSASESSESEQSNHQSNGSDGPSDAESDEFELLPTDTTNRNHHSVETQVTPPGITGKLINAGDDPSGVINAPCDSNHNNNDDNNSNSEIEPQANSNQSDHNPLISNKKNDEQPQKPNIKTAEARERKRQSRKRARQNAARRLRGNTSIYITGIPQDASEEELTNHFAKCGIILPNPTTGRPRIKLYTNDDGTKKGDALITYALRPSVENALTLLDDAPLRPPKFPLSVQEASFDHKQNNDDNKTKQQRTDNSHPTSSTQNQDRNSTPVVSARDLVAEALAWDDDLSERKSKAPKIVLLKNVFDPSLISKKDYDLVRDDMNEGCSACGELEKVTVFERNEQGAVAVRFKTTEAALKCIELMNHRWYDGRELSCEFYDGKTDYRYKETEADLEERDRKWEEWLQGSAEDGSGQSGD